METSFHLYKLAVPLAGLGIWARNLETRELLSNEIIGKILEAPEGVSSTFEDAIAFCEDQEEVRRRALEVISSQAPRSIVTPIRTLKGNKKWVRVHMQGEYKDGKCIMLYGTVEDITEEITLKKELEEREQLFSKAFENAPIGMALVGLMGNWIKVNLSLRELLGYTEDEFMSHSFQDFTHADDLKADLDLVEQLLRKEIRAYSMEKRYLHRNGSIVWAQLNVSLIYGPGELPLYFVSQIKPLPDKS